MTSSKFLKIYKKTLSGAVARSPYKRTGWAF